MRAFTLIESLLYLALFSLIIYGALTGVYALTASSERNQARASVESEGNFLLAKITYDITHSKSIESPLENRSSVTLALISDKGTSVMYENIAGVLMRTENSLRFPLSSNTMTLHSIDFSLRESTSSSASAQEVLISLQLQATADNGQPYTETFYGNSFIFP